MPENTTTLYVNNTFHLAITPNYGKIIVRIILLFLGMIAPIAFFGIAAANEIIDPKNMNMGVIFTIYLLAVVLGTFFVIRTTHFKDTVKLTNDSLQIPKLRDIRFDEIEKYKIFTARGISSYIITLKDGKKMAFGSTDNFSDDASKEFHDFIREFEQKMSNN